MKAKQGISKLLYLLLCIGIILSNFFLNTPFSKIVSADKVNNDVSEKLPDSYIKIAETDEIVLCTAHNYGIAVEDKRNGHLWSSGVDYEKYDEDDLNDLMISKMTALFDFKYTNTANKKYAIVAVDYTIHKPEVNTKPAKNGINMLYKFDKLGISIPLKISIEKNILTIHISVEEIKEEGDYHLISLDLLPFMGASYNKEQGYMFYPDGSGALFRFTNEPRKNINRSSFYIYGTDSLDIDKYEDNNNINIKAAMLPVFGIKKGEDAAFLAAITEGEYDVAVNFTPSGFSNIHLNRISPEFTYRRTYKDLRDNPNIPPRIETEMLKTDREVKYFFLANDNADYSGMANEYRNYLIEKGDLVKKIDENSIPMGLDLFMGIKEERILFDKFIQATTFKQAETILKEFSEQGVDNIQVCLIGWGAKGYGSYPVFFPPNSKLGGAGGLKELAEYTKEKGYLLYLDANFADANKDSGDFSVRNDTVYSKNGLIVSDMTNKKFLLNPIIALKRFNNQFISKAKEFKIDGLCFEQIGSQLYHDYHKKYSATREETAQYWQEMLEETGKQLGTSGVSGGNSYVLKHVDRLFDIPVEDSGNIITNEAIPFYQMVIHGYVTYSSTPGNLFYDFQNQKLKWVEYGCIPYFKLTYSKSDVLKYTDYNSLFSSYYKEWLDIASNIYKEFNERLGELWPKEIVKHEQLRENIYKVTYGGGTSVYINHNQANVFTEGYEIKAVDYLVVDKEGNMR